MVQHSKKKQEFLGMPTIYLKKHCGGCAHVDLMFKLLSPLKVSHSHNKDINIKLPAVVAANPSLSHKRCQTS